MLYPYWCYIGIPMSRMSFPIWAGMLISYLKQGAYVPRLRSQELTAAMDARIRELGGQVEYNTRVEKILVENGKVVGVELSSGEKINAPCVVSNASPSLVFNRMISPRGAAPASALKFANARKIGPGGFCVYLGIDASPEELGLEDYGYFISDNMNTDEIYAACSELMPQKMQATTCLNAANPDCSPPGTTMLCITILHQPEAWDDVAPRDYYKIKNEIAGSLIDQFDRATGAGIRGRIEEIEIATPATFARYTGAFNGGIYGYEQDPWDSVLARMIASKDEDFIEGLEFAGGFASNGHGYSPSLASGRSAALKALKKLGVKS
jgi:phytoene dehydrogenase-like protein